MKNLERFRIGKDFKNEKIIKQPAQFAAEIRKIEDVENIGRGQPNEFKGQKLIGEGKGRFRETQVERLKSHAATNKAVVNTRKIEDKRSVNKTSDTFDGAIQGSFQKETRASMNQAVAHAKSKKDVRFGEGENQANPDTNQHTGVAGLLNAPTNEMNAMFQKLRQTEPDSPVVRILEELLKKKNSQQSK